MAGGCGAEPRASQYGGATPGGVGTVRTANKDEYLFGKVITYAINEHWIRDIRETIWRKVMKKKDKLIRDYIKGVEANSKL